ncbi:hypothetical protein NFI96_029481, partial [Prochilodus magdalenae]
MEQNLKMNRKRHSKRRRKGADKAGGNNDSVKESKRKKDKTSETASSTSAASQSQNQPEDTLSRPEDKAEHQEPEEEANRAALPQVEAQTQTVRLNVKNKATQTEPVKQNSQHTQTETAERSTQLGPTEDAMDWESTPPEGGTAGNEKNEEKGTKGSMKESSSAEEKREESAQSVPQLDAEKEEESNKSEKAGGEDPKTSVSLSSADPGPKSYAAAASATNPTKEAKEQSNKTAGRQESKTPSKGEQRKTSPVRGPTGEPVLTFYVYIVVDKSFRFDTNRDKLQLHYEGGHIELEMTYFKCLGEKGYLIESKFPVLESGLRRGSVISYKYVVQQRHKVIEEMAMRNLQIPIESSVKEMHLFEAHMSRPGSFDWMRSWIKSADKKISEAWENSARYLLDRLFEKWTPSNQKSIQAFASLLKSYRRSYQTARERVFYYGNVPTPDVKVSELVERKLVKILNGEGGARNSESSADVDPLKLGLSVF